MRRAFFLFVFTILASCGCASDDAAHKRATVPASPDAADARDGTQGAGSSGSAGGTLTVDMAEPHFATGPAAAAARHFALEEWQPARDGFARYLADADVDADDRARLRLLIALCDARLGAWADAAAGFERAALGLPLLADYIRYQAARARYFAHDLDAALAHARAVDPASTSGDDAALLIGDILRARGAWAEVAAHYGAYLDDRPRGRPRGIRRTEATYRRAEALDKQGEAFPDAARLYRRVTIAAPLSGWAKRATERLSAILADRSKAERAQYLALTADELIERGMAYYDAMRNPESEADFTAALAAPDLTAEAKCVAAYHRANSVFKAREYKRAAPLFDDARAACKPTQNTDLQVKSAYQAGRSWARSGKSGDAVDRYAEAESIAAAANHSYADDSRLRQAEEQAALGRTKEVTELLSTLPDRYPDGDMRAEALWRLGWRAFRDGRYDEAIQWLDKQAQAVPIDDNYWAEGQAQYWLGRAWAAKKQPAKAAASYQEAVRRYPLSYYALLALNRLREDHPKAFEATMSEIRTVPEDEKSGPAFEFKPRPEYATLAFKRAIELMKLGLGAPAEAEFARLGLTAPRGKSRVQDPDQIEKLWAMAFLYDRAGRYETSHWMTRWHILDYKRRWPTGHNEARWRIAYPKAYWSLVHEHASEHGFPTEILMAIVREESAFDPLRESYANAIGLTQMIFPTARRFGKGTGIAITRENLRDPDKNVTIGSRFLSFLWDKWDGFAALVPPSYNAGEGATARWVRARGTLDADEWLEEIAGDQPRRYSKRVLSSYFTYAYLERGEIPSMPNPIPQALRDEADGTGKSRRKAKVKKAADKKAKDKKAADKKANARKATKPKSGPKNASQPE